MARRVPEGPPPAPVAQRLRIRYAKRGRLRFTSHRDFARAFERALRRAGLPMAYSAGFHPHPKISYVGASPTGAASEAEYLEIGLTRPLDPGEVGRILDAALPPGLDVVDVVEAGGAGGLAERMQAAHWRIELPGTSPDGLADAVAAFLAAPEAPVERMTKQGRRTVDARAAVVSAHAAAGDPPVASSGAEAVTRAILDVVVRQVTPAVRPDDVISALQSVAGLAPVATSVATRLAQGPLDDSASVGDPFAPDRATQTAPSPPTHDRWVTATD